jgi:hypothetical protein
MDKLEQENQIHSDKQFNQNRLLTLQVLKILP